MTHDTMWYLAFPFFFVVLILAYVVFKVTKRNTYHLSVTGLGIRICISTQKDCESDTRSTGRLEQSEGETNET
jgi:hypothetical protein